MPSFLEHLFTFRWREEPHLQASFRSEDTLESQAPRIEHCFNLVGVEYDSESKTEPFKHRQTAAYYSLDLESGKSTWIIVKANQIVRKRIEQYTGKLETHSQPTTPSSAFSLAMHSHLLIYEWAIQHWTAYIDFLEEQHSDLKKDAAYTPVSTLTADPAMVTEITRRTTGKNQQLDGQPGPPKAETNRSNSWYRRSTPQKTQKQNIPLKTIQTDRIDITKLFTFGNLQKLHRQAMKVQNGLSVLNQNKTVLQDMIRHFEYLESSEDFRKCIDIHKDFRNFVRKTQRCIRELENQQNRLSAVQTDLERVISLVCLPLTLVSSQISGPLLLMLGSKFNGILQYHNQRIGESYAQLAKASTDKMERLTLKTKHETVSIHVITILTLFFLPATFIAVRTGLSSLLDFFRLCQTGFSLFLTGCQTFFGSGVIEFEKEESTGQLGYWTVRWGALKLFGLVCAPLTCFVLSAWAVTYYRSRRRQKETLPTYAE